MFEHLQFEPFLDVDIALLAEDINKDRTIMHHEVRFPTHLSLRWPS